MMKSFCYVFVAFSSLCSAAASVIIENPRCEYLHRPLGIDVSKPRFSWELRSKQQGKLQHGYQILVSTDSVALSKHHADSWDSGKVPGSSTNQIHYQGNPLKSHTFYYWKVRSWDEEDTPSAWSEISRFSTGMLSSLDWKAQWIGDPKVTEDSVDRYNPHLGYFSEQSISPYTQKWIAIDLGKVQEVDAIKLHPIRNAQNLFPLHFKIELSSEPDFVTSEIISWALNDTMATESPFAHALTEPKSGRYVRVTISRLPLIANGQYGYGLAEIEILQNGRNIALNKAVSVSDTRLDNRWSENDRKWNAKHLLTDGFLAPVGGSYYKNIPPSPLLRKELFIDKRITQAFYYTSALGIYESYINGTKVSSQILAPEWTDYAKHVQYQTYEVSHLLKRGENVLGAMLADGWYAGGRWSHPGRGGYGDYARKFIGQLVIEYDDGTSETIITDGSWRYLAQGPITQVTMFGGEHYDAKNENYGWDRPGFDDSAWMNATVHGIQEAKLCAQMNEPIAVICELHPIAVHQVDSQKYVFDLGQNMVGWCQLLLPYNPQQPITLRYAEVLNDDGTLYTGNLRGATQTDEYHPAVEKKVNYEPRFTYHGFRFVEVDGLTHPPALADIIGKMVASSSPETGTFETSDTSINKLWENIKWTQLGNMISVPTDCPQRDEREGWMGDAHIFAQTAIYNLDMAAFYTKWVRDIRDNQLVDGRLPDFAPHDGHWVHFYNVPGWADAGVIVPWRVYQNYNDTVILAEQYDCMKRFIDFVHRHNPDLRWRSARGNMYGDWLNGNTIVSDDYPKTGGQVPNDVYSTAYFAYSTAILAKTARLLGKESDHSYYQELAANIRKTFVEHYVSDDGTIEGNTQAGYALALELDLLPLDLRSKAAAHMVESIKDYDYRISTGIQTTVRLMNQLSEYGYSDIAYKLLTSRRFPSWLYSIDQGATTIWERWDGYVSSRGFQDPGMNSFNHVAIGAVGEWMYRHMLGIQVDDSQPGYRHFHVKPQPGEGIDWIKGSYRAITGTIAVAWKNRDGKFTLAVSVPANTEATIVMPYSGETHRVMSGEHSFVAQQ